MRKWLPYLFLLPTLIVFVVFYAVPIVDVVRNSLYRDDAVKIEFVGLKNYIDIVSDAMYWRAFVNSLIYGCLFILSGTTFATAVVLNIHTWKPRAQSSMRFLFYTPAIVSPIVMAGAWKWIFSYRGGLMNYLVGLVGLGPVHWLGSRLTGIPSLNLIVMGFGMGGLVLFLSVAAQSISPAMLEVAKMDGATEEQIRRRIILPFLMPWILYVMLLQIIAGFAVWEIIWMFTDGGPMGYTASMLYNIFETGFTRSAYGIASAKTLVMVAIILVLAIGKGRLEGLREI